MDNVTHETIRNNKPTNGKGAWRLSDKERDERRATADELSQQNERDRDRLRQAQARAAEVKELIKATDLGAEAEELKNEIKHLETSIDARSETVERCLREARTGKTDRQQESLPGVPPAADKAPKAPPPKPSAAERTVPLLPEWSGPIAGEAQVHEGGAIAPEPPRELPALPPAAAAHPDAIEAEIVDEAAEARARELWRGLVLDALEEEGPLPLQPLHAEVDGGCYDKGTVAPDTAQMKALLATMTASGAVVVDDQERYALPTPPKGKKKKPTKKAAPKAKPQPKKPAKSKKSKGAKAEAEAPLPPSPPMVREETDFKDLGPTRKPLTNWLHGRLLWAGETGARWPDLLDELDPSPYFADELNAAASLLVAVGLARREVRPGERRDYFGRTQNVYVYFGQVDEHGRSVDETVLDEIAGTLADGPQRLDELAPSLAVPQWALLDVLDELHQAGRARRLDDGSWALGAPQAEAAE